MKKHERDNRANQLNPNNAAYWKSRQGGKSGSSSVAHTSSYTPSYCSSYSSLYSSYSRESYEFVAKPERKGLFGRKTSDTYAWVVCNHVGEFLTDPSYPEWSNLFSRAVVFESEKQVKTCVDELKRSPLSHGKFYHIRCVKIK